MNQAHYLLLSLVTYILEGVILFMYCERVFNSMYSLARRILIITAAYSISTALCAFQNVYINVLAFLAGTIAAMCFAYYEDFRYSCMHAFLLTLSMVSTELAVFSFFPQYGANITGYVDEFSINLLYYILSKLLYFVVAFIISHIIIRDTNAPFTLSNRQFALMLAIVMAFCLVSITYIKIFITVPVQGNTYIMMIACAVAMILFSFLIVELYYYIEKQNKINYELKTQLLIEKTLVSNKNAVIEADMNQKLLIHDIKKHLTAIDAMCTSEDTRKISEYIDEVIKSDRLATPYEVSDIELLNAITTRYMDMCKKNKIDMYVDIRSKAVDFMSDYDMTSLFSNLLDNAYEAASNAAKPMIEFSIRPTNAERTAVIIVVRNTCIRNPFDRWGHLVSNKETPAMHGYGIKSIERVVNAYGGMMYMYFEEKTSMFHTDILFYKPKKENAAGDISGLQDNV